MPKSAARRLKWGLGGSRGKNRCGRAKENECNYAVQVKAENPGIAFTEINAVISKKWNALSEVPCAKTATAVCGASVARRHRRRVDDRERGCGSASAVCRSVGPRARCAGRARTRDWRGWLGRPSTAVRSSGRPQAACSGVGAGGRVGRGRVCAMCSAGCEGSTCAARDSDLCAEREEALRGHGPKIRQAAREWQPSGSIERIQILSLQCRTYDRTYRTKIVRRVKRARHTSIRTFARKRAHGRPQYVCEHALTDMRHTRAHLQTPRLRRARSRACTQTCCANTVA